MEKIAIIGLGCLFPGAETPEQYWHNLLARQNTTSTATAAQMGVDPNLFLAPGKGVQDKYYCMQGGYINGFKFDPHGYHLPADFLASLDDLFKWPLYVSREALADSGYLENPAALARCGVVLGNLSFPTQSSHRLFAPIYRQAIEPPTQELLGQPFELAQLAATGPVAPHNLMTFGYPTAVVGRALGLGGVSFALDAACASSLYAVKLAGQYLLAGKTDLMLAGAVSRADPFFINMGFSIFQAYPENGHSHPLNKTSGGLFAGEGAGVFVLKRYRDAMRDGDRIYAVISGIGLSNDGKGKFLLQPNPKGQILAFERAYAAAQVDPRSIDYVECHATGTPVGDKTELNSMDTFFGRSQAAPRVGSVKSNLGHLLTVAGMAGMTKVILSMAHRQIPATINLTEPLSSKNNVISAAQIVTETIPWPQQDHTKRAAVSAFGFGGANAHLILEEHPAGQSAQTETAASRPTQNQTKLAIIGMDAFFGGCNGLDSFGRTIYEGRQHFIAPPPGRWQGIENRTELLKAHGLEAAPAGAYITDFEMDFLHYKIPPNNDQPIPQQLLILNVADRALRDAGLAEGGNVAVIIGAGTELSLHRFRGRVDLSWQIRASLAAAGIELTPAQTAELERITKDSIHEAAEVNQYTSFIGNIMASRIAAQWDFSGPTFTLSAEENSAFKALEVAQLLLATGEVDAVVVGAVDLAGGVENVLLRHQLHPVNSGTATLSFDQQANGWLVGEGAGAVVLKRHQDALAAGNRIYAVIEAVSVVEGATGAEGVALAARQALAAAGVSPAEIGYLEVYGSGLAPQDEAEINGLTSVYQADAANLTCAMGSSKANIGHTFAAAGMASLIKTAHCLYHRYIPATPGWSGPKLPETWRDSPFYVAPHSQPWLAEHRLAAISGLGSDGAFAHLLLTDEPTQVERPNNYLANAPLRLFPIAGADLPDLRAQLNALRAAIAQNEALGPAARLNFEAFRQQATAPYALAIVGRHQAEILREIDLALKTIDQTFAGGEPWKTPLGSYFTPNPLGAQGKVAFVYPGAFSSYPGLGRDLFHLFPALHPGFAAQVANPGQLVGERALFPRSLNRLSEQQLNQLTFKLMADSMTMLQSGATYSTLVTKILREQFGLQPHAALGYSLGETTMMYALGLWSVQDNNSAELLASPLFRERLSGPKNAVREFWGMDELREQEEANRKSKIANRKSDDIWAIFVLKAPAEQAQQAVNAVERVYLTHINTAHEVVIGGDPAACRQVIAALGCEAMPVPYTHVIHCEPMRSEAGEFRRLNSQPLVESPSCHLYFAAQTETGAVLPHQLTSDAVGQNIATAVTQPVNFPALIQRAYHDGYRIFIELGPRSACTWWVADILKTQPYLATGINRRSVDDHTALVTLLAQLVSQRVPLDLSPLYEPLPAAAPANRTLVRTVSLLEPGINDVILTEENRQKFKDVKRRQPDARSQITDNRSQITEAGSDRLLAQKNNGILMNKPNPNPAETPSPVKAAGTAPLDDDSLAHQFEKLAQNTSLAADVHATFLRGRAAAMRHMRRLVELEILGQPAPEHQPVELRAISPAAQQRPNNYSQPEHIIWNEAELLEYAGGRIEPIFGPEYAIIDTYSRRVRLPIPPYLLVSRITKLNAVRGEFKPSQITTEYDIPFDAWYSTDGQIPWAVSVESGQCDLMLISYLGIDFANKGERVYRLLDCTLTFLDDMPLEGHTLRYDISIDSFAKSGESLLFFFSYNCFVGDKMVLKMRGGCAGFFTDEELAGGKGIITTEKEKADKAALPKQHFEPRLVCAQTSFNRAELLRLVHGDIAGTFGPQYNQHGLNPSLRLPPEGILMVDRITTVDPRGGAWGLGLIVSEKDLEPEHWYFPCHFSDDQVMAGSLVAEGCSQLLQFYLLYLGLQTQTRDARFQPVRDLPQVVRTRKQITACSSKLIYRMEITEIGLEPHPYAKANVDIIFEGRVVVDFKNLGLQLVEKTPNDPFFKPELAQTTVEILPPPKPALFNEEHIENFALGSISACFGPDYQIFEGRRIPRTPNGDLKLISRIVEINATRLKFTGQPNLVSEYDVPAAPWWNKQNSYPVMPYSILMEIGLQPCGFLSAYLGSTLAYPNEDFYFRNLDGDGHLLRVIDLRGKTIRNRVELLSATAIQGIIIQKFSYQLAVDDAPFYAGTAVFGYFKPQSLANQVGLDQGKKVAPWYEQAAGLPVSKINLTAPSARQQWYQAAADKPFYRLAGDQLNFLDEALVIPGGGRHGQGYIFASKKINPQDWFFSCHFYQDPVMPGSLGVEAILQALQIFALHQNLGAQLKSPHFTHVADHQTVWIYRGQMTPSDTTMRLEIHLTGIETAPGQVTLRGDASLWKGDLRIYEVKQIGLRLAEA